ncbi:MAG: prepilin peptidase [Patescibacteria group bacterium]|nr:prepilin peptidase [Patescibacteria group bacterium]
MIILFTFGLFLGSFLNVLVDRIPKKETVFRGRSHCEFCKKELKWLDLIPLASFLFLKGKCRYCHKKLSFYYPIIELSTAIMFTLTYVYVNSQFSISNFQLISQFPIFNNFIIYYSLFIDLFYYLFIVSSFIVIFFSDLKYGIIADKIVFPAVIVSLAYSFIIFHLSFIIYLVSGIGSFIFFLLLFVVTKGKGMGFGDVKLSFLLGLALGFPKIILALYLAFLTGAISGIILILWRKKRSLKETIPFGPFLIIGALVSLFWGRTIIPSIVIFLGF